MSFMPRKDDGELPSYYEVIGGAEPTSDNQPRITVQEQVQDELLKLAIKFNNTRNSKLQEVQTQDGALLNLLLPQINAFLSEYAHAALLKATLIIIPDNTINEGALPCDDDLRSPDEFSQVKTLGHAEAGDIDPPRWPKTAERLAEYLRPRTDNAPKQSTEPQAQLAEAPAKNKSWWKKSTPVKPTGSSPSNAPLEDKKVNLPRVTMDVKAEEIAFRSQSLLGLYETQNVWGIVCRIHVNTE